MTAPALDRTALPREALARLSELCRRFGVVRLEGAGWPPSWRTTPRLAYR